MRWLVVSAALAAGCGSSSKPKEDDPNGSGRPLPPPPALPAVPRALPPRDLATATSPELVELGAALFSDRRLSISGRHSCATCHDPARGYASGKLIATASGKPYPRRAPPLINLAWHGDLGWDGRYATLTDQLAAHIPSQLGLEWAAAIAKIADDGDFTTRATRAATTADAQLAAIASAAIEAYVMTRFEPDGRWDRAEREADYPAELKAGYQLFTGKARCAICHTPPLYTDLRYHRIGLIASPDEGRGRIDPAAKGAFKTPTLRGAARRDGFFHDASAPTLDAAIDWHLAGGVGQGADPSIIDPALQKVALSPTERAALGMFVRALTSE